MKAQNKILVTYVAIIAAILTIAKVVTFLMDIDCFAESPHVLNDEDCFRIRSLGDSEDQTRFDDNSIFITEWRILRYDPKEEDRHGRIHVVSGFGKSKAAKSTKEFVENHLEIKPLPIVGFPEGVYFHPHGMFFREQERELYVVNHAYAKGGERIEVFGIDVATDEDGVGDGVPSRLHYKYSITSDWMKTELNGILNSLVVVEKNKFYVTQYEPEAQDLSEDGWLSLDNRYKMHLFVNIFFKPRHTYVLYCEYGMPSESESESESAPSLDCRRVADGFVMANGITSNPDYSQIFVADVFGKTISVFDRNASTNDLTGRIDLSTTGRVDNLKFDPVSGRVYGGAITNFFWSLKNGALHYPQEIETSTSSIIEVFQETKTTGGSNSKIVSSSWKAREIMSTGKLGFATNSLRMNDYHVMGSGGMGFDGLLVCPVVADPVVTKRGKTGASSEAEL